MHTHPLIPAFIAGMLSTGLFVAVVAIGLGFFFLFLPTLPLFWYGLGVSPRLALVGAGLAAVAITALSDWSTGLLYLLMLGLPAWYISRAAILSRPEGEARLWFPLGVIFTRLVFYACAMVALTSLVYAAQGISLEQTLSQQIRDAFDNLGPQYRETVDRLASHWSFLIFSLGIWLWSLVLYAHAWFINRQLARRKKNIRPDFAVDSFAMPTAALLLLGIGALFSLSGASEGMFLGKSLLVALLCPYFYLGAALMHETSKSWPSRRFFLFFVYLMVFAQFWPALILSGAGLIHHIKRLSLPGGSSKS